MKMLALSAACLLAGCGEQEDSQARGQTASPQAREAGRAVDRQDAAPHGGDPVLSTREKAPTPAPDDLARRSHLGQMDGATPGRWLASREAGHDVPEMDPAVERWNTLLADADSRFDESGRMIANRLVQLTEMLAEKDLAEPGQRLLADLSALAVPGARAGFGTVCQYYFNLRRGGMERDAALALLKTQAPPSANRSRSDPLPSKPAEVGRPAAVSPEGMPPDVRPAVPSPPLPSPGDQP
ncbi:hypothetical protein MWN34_13685 [Ancylobacter sp. 6x-1]|uniref:Lipoprotein n=1 Tax=Ancylobacter crimeensis TaxID=2579147 RepID=A0ABT0DDD2_9HYPH|nr:hypothetical protein [Ancylobacter crimeensis]MCK0197960.1 hypothetical protein [Ancylobacter crimeensis]